MCLAVGVFAGCGGSSSSDKSNTVAGNANADAVQVIQSWADVVQNGTAPLTLTTRQAIEVFNQSLPCGARLTAATDAGRYTVATFVLTERPGPGRCGSGVGDAAKTAFVIHNGHIVEWRRVVDSETTGPTSTAPVI